MNLYRLPAQRLRDHAEVERPLTPDELREQALRCMDCGIPFCHGAGCPLSNAIPDINAAAAAGDWERAWELLSATSPFPEFTSRVCPALCEGSCVNGIDGAPVMTRQLEKAVINHAFEHNQVRPPFPAPFRPRTGKRIAIIGAGPAGLTLADALNRLGHSIEVYEKNAHIGGLLRYGIPDFKLSKNHIERRRALMEQAGITFHCNTTIGADISAAYLQRHHDALALAIGTPAPRDLPIPGRALAGIHFALDFLTAQNRANSNEPAPFNATFEGRTWLSEPAGECSAANVNAKRSSLPPSTHTLPTTNYQLLQLTATGKHVVIIGGGDTGSDCVGTSHRQNAASALQIEIMPQPPETRSPSTPWPEWPYQLRTSSSHKEGGSRRWSLATKRFIGQEGHITALEVIQVEWEFTPQGRPLKYRELPGTAETIPADLVLIAMGFTGVPPADPLLAALGLSPDARGRVISSPARKIFTAGDSANGASLVVRAIADAKRVAQEIDAKLKGV